MGRNFTYGTPGVSNVGSYQMAGLPYLSGSEDLDAGEEDRHSFDPIAMSVTVFNHGSQHIRVAFAPTGSMNTPATTHHYITLSGTAAEWQYINHLKWQDERRLYLKSSGTRNTL